MRFFYIYRTFSSIYTLPCSSILELYRPLHALYNLQKLQSVIYFIIQFHFRTLPSTWFSVTVKETSRRYILYHAVPSQNCTVHLMTSNIYRTFSPIYIIYAVPFKNSTVHMMPSNSNRISGRYIFFIQFHLRTVTSTWCSLTVTELSVRYILYHAVPFKNCTVQWMFSNSYRNFSPISILSCSSI